MYVLLNIWSVLHRYYIWQNAYSHLFVQGWLFSSIIIYYRGHYSLFKGSFFPSISSLLVTIFQFLHIFFLSYTFFNLSNGYYLSLSYFSFYIISLSPILFLYYVFLYLWNWKFHKDVITPESFFPVVNDLFHC